MKKFKFNKIKPKHFPTVDELMYKFYKIPSKDGFLKALEGYDYITSYAAFKKRFNLTEEQAYKEFTELGY